MRCVFLSVLTSVVFLTLDSVVSNAAPADPYRPSAIATEEVPSVPPQLWDRLRQYHSVRSAMFSGWSSDGRGILVATQFGNTMQLHRVYEPGGRREQITFFDEPVRGTFVPKAIDGGVLLTMSKGGNENYQVYLLDRLTGKAALLTDGASRNQLEAIRPDGGQIIISSTKRNGSDTDLYIGDPRKSSSFKMLLQTKKESWNAADWSQDGTKVLLDHYVSINETYPALLDLATGEKKKLTIPANGKAAYRHLAFLPDGQSAYITTDARGEFQQLARVDLNTLEYQFNNSDISWDVSSVMVEPKTGLTAFTVNEDGASALYLLRDNKRERVTVPLGLLSGMRFSPDGKHLGFTLARPDAPADAYSIAVEGYQLTRWTYSEVGGLNPSVFVTPTRIHFPSFDNRKIPAYYYKPASAKDGKPVPVIISIHGGPESQFQPIFSGLYQFYLNELGCAVVAPNVRGSAGYGKTYLTLDNAEKREDSVRDIGALLDWIGRQPELDASRVAVMGGSYGGYMVLASLTNFPDRIKAGIDIVGIASFKTFLKNTSGYRQDLRRVEYGDERDEKMQEVFARIDPLNNAGKIRSALLVVHGRNDPRVPFSEAVQIAAKVRNNGRSVWTVYADNEGHGFARRENRDYLDVVMAMFLQANLKGAAQ
ncbi:MAG TPA: alpha/beta fold hydrolase [Gemmataceae bacterium]|jgi:dipeptidyl aminopeptidase/acylaminoacyl peptidase